MDVDSLVQLFSFGFTFGFALAFLVGFLPAAFSAVWGLLKN